jgi:hypothetical protein
MYEYILNLMHSGLCVITHKKQGQMFSLITQVLETVPDTTDITRVYIIYNITS